MRTFLFLAFFMMQASPVAYGQPESEANAAPTPEVVVEVEAESGSVPPEQQLMGLSASALEGVLGEPTLLRPEAPAQLWQYADDLCVLQIFLYEPIAGGEAVVEYIEARMRGVDQPPMNVDQVRPCLVAQGINMSGPDAAE
jgi:hypothetical protein